ncbi:hypothetical protein GFM09_33710 [Rhizobium leguminosarum bv. viciae]|jgi:hypothetical protein|uniref:hypothetical protein n=1 Tax=Rhizobium leguminosarum TaxID=384 RepID=UPI00197FC366|nr:hypothetical protein [Rhizobium leguminosarum]NKL74104.1 hypothetical protein [Rhizobium leguminosarum bv. viciae]
MIVATEAPAVQWIPDPSQTGDFDERRYVKALEILSMQGVDFSLHRACRSSTAMTRTLRLTGFWAPS